MSRQRRSRSRDRHITRIMATDVPATGRRTCRTLHSHDLSDIQYRGLSDLRLLNAQSKRREARNASEDFHGLLKFGYEPVEMPNLPIDHRAHFRVDFGFEPANKCFARVNHGLAELRLALETCGDPFNEER